MGHGTGTYLTYKDNAYIITAAHVIQDADFSGVIHNKEIYWVEPLIVFTDRDIAILRVATIPNKESVDLKKVKVAKKIEIGDRLVYTGYPNLTGPLTIFGTVAGYSGETSVILQSYAWGGASGSLILNEKGELVGILSGIELAHTDLGRVENETIVIADIIPQELGDILDHVNTN
jgi:S1-C subfamily serine protease